MTAADYLQAADNLLTDANAHAHAGNDVAAQLSLWSAIAHALMAVAIELGVPVPTGTAGGDGSGPGTQ